MSCQTVQRREQYDCQAMNRPLLTETNFTCQNNCQLPIDTEKVSGYSDLSDSYANLCTAFSESVSMAEFQNKMMSHNPLLAQNLIDHGPRTGISPHPLDGDCQTPTLNQNIQNLMEEFKQDKITNLNAKVSSEGKMNNNIDELICNTNNNTNSLTGVNNVKQQGNWVPLTRQQYYDPRLFGTNLLEGYYNNNSVPGDNNFFKLILLFILLGAIFYGIYWLCHNNNKKNYKQIPSSDSLTLNSKISKMIANQLTN